MIVAVGPTTTNWLHSWSIANLMTGPHYVFIALWRHRKMFDVGLMIGTLFLYSLGLNYSLLLWKLSHIIKLLLYVQIISKAEMFPKMRWVYGSNGSRKISALSSKISYTIDHYNKYVHFIKKENITGKSTR